MLWSGPTCRRDTPTLISSVNRNEPKNRCSQGSWPSSHICIVLISRVTTSTVPVRIYLRPARLPPLVGLGWMRTMRPACCHYRPSKSAEIKTQSWHLWLLCPWPLSFCTLVPTEINRSALRWKGKKSELIHLFVGHEMDGTIAWLGLPLQLRAGLGSFRFSIPWFFERRGQRNAVRYETCAYHLGKWLLTVNGVRVCNRRDMSKKG